MLETTLVFSLVFQVCNLLFRQSSVVGLFQTAESINLKLSNYSKFLVHLTHINFRLAPILFFCFQNETGAGQLFALKSSVISPLSFVGRVKLNWIAQLQRTKDKGLMTNAKIIKNLLISFVIPRVHEQFSILLCRHLFPERRQLPRNLNLRCRVK